MHWRNTNIIRQFDLLSRRTFGFHTALTHLYWLCPELTLHCYNPPSVQNLSNIICAIQSIASRWSVNVIMCIIKPYLTICISPEFCNWTMIPSCFSCVSRWAVRWFALQDWRVAYVVTIARNGNEWLEGSRKRNGNAIAQLPVWCSANVHRSFP